MDDHGRDYNNSIIEFSERIFSVVIVLLYFHPPFHMLTALIALDCVKITCITAYRKP